MPIFRKDGKNILFIHIPKTGGTTIEMVFKNSGYQTLYLDGKVGRNSVNHLRKCTPQHMHADMLQDMFWVQHFDMAFMIVRNPVTRFKSEYIWRNRKKFTGTDSKAVKRWADRSFHEYESNNFIYDNHFRPQAEFYIPGTEVYRFEDGLQNAINMLNDKYKLSLDTEIPNLKDAKERTGFSSSDVTVTPEIDKKVKDFYRKDYEMFDYQL